MPASGASTFIRGINRAGQHFLMRVGSNVHLLQELGYYEFEDNSTVYLWPDDRCARSAPWCYV